jgi:peptidylprolyl isomerase
MSHRLPRYCLISLLGLLAIGLPVGCIEVAEMLAAIELQPPPEEPAVDDDANDSGETTTEDADEFETYGPEAPSNDDGSDDSDAVDDVEDVDTNGEDDDMDDVDTNGEDADTNGEESPDDDADTSGVPPLPEGAVLTTTASGLQYYDFVVGGGEMPELTSSVRVSYVGYLEDGTIFDQNPSATFALSQVVAGFGEGVAGMNVGGRRRLIIPPDLGYGPNGNPSAGIGGDDLMIFDIELFEIIE